MKRFWITFSATLGLAAAVALAQQPTLAPTRAVAKVAEKAPTPEKAAIPAPPAPKPSETVTRPDAKPPAAPQDASYLNLSPGDLQATPDMWFYQQAMRQHQDPSLSARRAAEYHAQQLAHRQESRRWFGFSGARPQASPDPFNGDYSPAWTSNHLYNPSRWVGGGF